VDFWGQGSRVYAWAIKVLQHIWIGHSGKPGYRDGCKRTTGNLEPAISGTLTQSCSSPSKATMTCFKQAGISWKTQSHTLQRPRIGRKKTGNHCLVGSTPDEIESNSVFLLDECHLLWAMFVDIFGEDWPTYWGSLLNERVRQTYFCALDYRTQNSCSKPSTGNSENTIAFFAIPACSTTQPTDCPHLGWRSYHRRNSLPI